MIEIRTSKYLLEKTLSHVSAMSAACHHWGIDCFSSTRQSGDQIGIPPDRRIKVNHLRISQISVLSLLMYLLVSQLAFAGQPVDPSTLNPPPPPEFNPVCEKAGNQTICTVQFSDPPFAGGSGIFCGNGISNYEVFVFQTRSVIGHRYYDQNGNLTRRLFHEVDGGTLSNPLTHTALSFSSRLTTRHELSVSGDVLSGTEFLTGNTRVYQKNGGTIVFEAGRTITAGDGTFIQESGQHPLQDYFIFGNTAGIQPLCDALE